MFTSVFYFIIMMHVTFGERERIHGVFLGPGPTVVTTKAILGRSSQGVSCLHFNSILHKLSIPVVSHSGYCWNAQFI